MSAEKELVEDLKILIDNCRTFAESFGQAFDQLNDQVHIVKLSNQRLNSLVLKRSNGTSNLVPHIISNFRSENGEPLSYIECNGERIATPMFWPNNLKIAQSFGVPNRSDHANLMVDAYFLSSYWNDKICSIITKLPELEVYGF